MASFAKGHGTSGVESYAKRGAYENGFVNPRSDRLPHTHATALFMYPNLTPLLAAARPLIGEFTLSHSGMSAGTVAAAVQTVSGRIYTGVCLDLACGIGFCAEHAAIAEMLKHRETHIYIILAVCEKGVLPPCGRCRELLLQVDSRNSSTWVALPGGKVATLSNLLPNHWLNAEG